MGYAPRIIYLTSPKLEHQIKVKYRDMKFILSLLLVLAVNTAFGQSFYKASSKSEFKSLMDKGVYFLKTGDSLRDADFISAINENWDVTKVSVYDPADEGSEKLTGKEIFFIEANFLNDGGSVLGLLPLGLLKSGSISKYSMIGFIATNGFDQTEDSITKMKYLDLTISGLNDVVKSIKDDEIKKIGVGLYKAIYKSVLPKSKALKNKTLLIVGETKDYVSESALVNSNIKFKKVSVAEYDGMEGDDLNEYCLLYFAYNSYTEISIYNLENNDLIFTRHFASGKRKLTSIDVTAMQKHWK